MRILLVAPCFPPYPSSASLRTHGFARSWRSAGHDVTVLTTEKAPDHRGMPLDPGSLEVVELPVPAPASLRWLRRRLKGSGPTPAGAGEPRAAVEGERRGEAEGGGEGGSAVARRAVDPPDPPDPPGAGPADGAMPRGLTGLRERTGAFSSVRMPDLTDHWIRPAADWARRRAADAGPWDLVVTSAGPYTAHLVGLRLRGGADRDAVARAWVADYRDLWTDNELYRGVPVLARYERRLEDRCLGRADAVTTVSAELAAILRRRTSAPVSVVYNGFDPLELARLDPSPLFPPDDRVRIAFTGRLYEQRQDPGALMAAVAGLRREAPELGRRLRLVVAGHDARPWQRLARRHGITDFVEPLGWVSRETSLRLQRDADALLHVEWSDREAGVLTAKLFEYLAAGPPILVVGGDPGGDGPIARLVRETGRGAVLGRDRARIADELRRLVAGRRGPAAPAGGRDRRTATAAGPRRDARLARFERATQAMQVLELAARCPSS